MPLYICSHRRGQIVVACNLNPLFALVLVEDNQDAGTNFELLDHSLPHEMKVRQSAAAALAAPNFLDQSARDQLLQPAASARSRQIHHFPKIPLCPIDAQ